jgi:hypothetical protein
MYTAGQRKVDPNEETLYYECGCENFEKEKEEEKGWCSCMQEPYDICIMEPFPPVPTEAELQEAAKESLEAIWGGNLENVPGYVKEKEGGEGGGEGGAGKEE